MNNSDIQNNVKLTSESRQVLAWLLSISLLRPFQEYGQVNIDLLESSFKKLGLKLKEDFKTPNKNPFIPYCEWKLEAIGEDVGYNTPMCDQFKAIHTENGICFATELQGEYL